MKIVVNELLFYGPSTLVKVISSAVSKPKNTVPGQGLVFSVHSCASN